MLTALLKVYPETKGVPLEEMDIVFGEGMYRFPSRVQISDQITIGGENKHARYASSGGFTSWFKRIFTKDGSSMGNNRTRNFTGEREESYAPLRADHDDHDHDDEGQDGDEDEGEEYEMIKRNPGHEREN